MAGCVVEAALLDLVLRSPGKAEPEMRAIKAKREAGNLRVWRKVDRRAETGTVHLVAVAGSEG
jgi:hypothetical protein